MVTYYVKLNEIYTITATDECRVYNASGVQVATCPANESINVKAATAKLKLSDDNAAIKKAVSESGGGTSEECEQHIANSDIHTTAVEKANCANHIANSEVHVTSAEKTQIANSAQVDKINTFTSSNYFNPNQFFKGNLIVDGKIILNNVIQVKDGIHVLNLARTTALGAAAYGLSVSASGGLQLFGTHFMIGDPFSDTALKIVNPELAVYSSDTAAIGFDYANKVIFRSMPNDGTEGTYEIQCWQWEDESHTSKKEAGVKLLKASQVSELEDYSVLNKSENDTLYAPKTYDTANAILITDGNGNVTASTVISVSELNTLNNNVTNLATKLADLESRLAALES